MKKEQKTVSLTLRVTPTVKQLAERLAAEDGRSIASYIERLILKAGGELLQRGSPERASGKTRG